MVKKFVLPELPYEYSALEPVISADIMKVHHQKHHQAYVTNLNAALEKYEEAEKNGELATLISLQPAIRFNGGGGHINHSLFWQNLAPKNKGGGGGPKGALEQALKSKWGSLDTFIECFNAMTGAIQGSGWGWLGLCKKSKNLTLSTCANQDPLEGTSCIIPLLGVDVWEHAYYLQYKNARADYLKEIWQIINWNAVAERFQKAQEHCSTCSK